MSGGIHRDITCRKCGNLTHHEIKELTNITFLNHGEIKNIEMLFLFLLEVAEEQVAAGADHKHHIHKLQHIQSASPPGVEF